MKRTFKKVLSTVVASLFVLQSASLATVGIGAADTNEVLKYTPTIDAVKDDAYATSYKKVVGDVTYSYLYDDSYIYLFVEGTMPAAAGNYLNQTLTITPLNDDAINNESINFIIQPFHNPTSGVVGNVQMWQDTKGKVNMGSNIPSGAADSSEFKITVNGDDFTAEVRVANKTSLNKEIVFASGNFVNGSCVAGEGDYWGFWQWGAHPSYTVLTLGATYSATHTHVYEDEFTEDTRATCSKAGSKSRHCVDYAECKGVTDITPIPKTAHDIVDGTCSVCGQKIVLQETAKVDGNIEGAYKKSAQINLDLSNINNSNAGGASYADEPQQVSGATAYFLWDNDNIYVAVDVKDPTGGLLPDAWNQYGDSNNMTYSESVIVSIFRDVATQTEAAGIRINAYQPFAYKQQANGDDLGAKWNSAADYLKNNSKYAVSTYDGGYIVEYALDGTKLAEGNKYLVNLGICDVIDYSLNVYGGVQKSYFIGHAWETPVDGTIELSGQKYNHTHVWESDYTIDVKPTCTKMGVKSIHCVDYAECGGVDSRTEIPKLAHTAGELTTTEPTCVEQGKVTSVCTVCGNPFTVETTPALGHTTTSGKCERCGEYVNAPSKVPYVTAAVDGTKDAAYDSGAKYYVNGATAYVVYDKDYFYVYIEADDAENVAYFTIGNPDKTDNVGPFWSNTAEIKFDFTAKNLWTTDSFACSIFNQNGASTFADNISVDTGATLIAKAGVDYAFADSKNAVELKIHIGEGYAPNNYIGRAYVGNSIYNIGLGTEENGINLKNYGGNLTVAVLNGALTNIVLDSCLGGCVNTERVTTVEPTCTAVGTSVEKCTVCGAEVEGSAQDVAMLDHDYKRTVTVEATCEVAGTSAEKCTVCGAIKDGTAVEIPALGHDWEYEFKTEPTCTDEGRAYTKYCKRSGCDNPGEESESGDIVVPALGHNYNELGICANCGDNKSLKVATYSVTLMDVLNINAKINKADVAAYDSLYVKFVEHRKENLGDVEKIVTEYSYEASKDRYVFAYGSTPQCAVDDVDVYVYGVKDGVTYESTAVYTANITSYLYTMLGRSTDTSLNRLMVHLLDYIAAAQQFKDYSTDALANANLTDAMKALRLPANTDYKNTFSKNVNEGASGITYKARQLYCDDSISFKYNFTIDDSQYNTENIKVVVKYKENGELLGEFSGKDIVYDTARSRYYVVVGVFAQNLSEELEINVYTLDGTLISDKTIVNSIESMASAYAAYPQYTDFLAAMMQYGRAAAAYAYR